MGIDVWRMHCLGTPVEMNGRKVVSLLLFYVCVSLFSLFWCFYSIQIEEYCLWELLIG